MASETVWLAEVELGVCLWQGRFEKHETTWLRWFDAEGRLIPTGAERAEKLAEQLRRLGVDPEA